jgi:hypothetical protein
MRPFDEIPFEESDYSDVALMVASVREWPSDDFVRELDARLARRFEPEPGAAGGGRGGRGRAGRVARGRLPRWAAGPAVALVAGAVAAVVVVSGGGGLKQAGLATHASQQAHVPAEEKPAVNGTGNAPTLGAKTSGISHNASSSAGTPTNSGAAAQTTATLSPFTQSANGTAAPVAPGSKQIQSAQISLSTANIHVDQVAQEVFTLVGAEHGTVQSSHITTATQGSGGGYASFSLSVPTSNLQDTMTQLSRLHYAAVVSRDDSSQNVSHQYNSDQRRLNDARALRASLLKQLQSAYTQTDIDSIKAQLKLAEQQITTWQNTLGSLQHKISYSNVSVQINQNGLPIRPVVKHHSSGFTVGRAGHDALRVLVVSAGVALIALAVLIPVGLVAALLMWLWVWLRQRRREHALDATS